MPTILSVTEAARHFSDAINRVVFRGEHFLLLRGKRQVAELRPVRRGVRLSELSAALSTVPHLAPDDAAAFAADIDRARATLTDVPLRDPVAGVSPTADQPILIDSSVLIAAERRKINLARITTARANPCFISVVTASELLHGVHRATDPGVRAARAAYVEGILSIVPLLDIDLATARAHADLWASLERAGTPIGPHDLWIAASAIASGSAIATANIREFNRVPGLAVEAWSAEFA